MGSGILASVPAVFAAAFPGRQALVVTDDASFTAAGRQVSALLREAGLEAAPPFLYHDRPLPAESRFVTPLEAALRSSPAVPVAVGSGTINDLVKLAAHRTQRPYLCVATAASMDGYSAFGASITHEGAKQTFNCPAPAAIVADISVIATAPGEMVASGYADLQAKVTAGADWILADGLGIEAIDPRAWNLVQGGLRTALADPAGARAGREVALTQLVEGLMLGGFAMQWAESSRPASGAEHQFSHLWDMEHHLHHGQPPSHGFKVGIATLAIAALYEQLLAQPFDQLDVAACVSRWPDYTATEQQVRHMFAPDDFLPTALTETRAKHPTRDELSAQLNRLKATWPQLRTRLQAQLLPYAEMSRRLVDVGAPTQPEQIGITRERLRASFVRALHIRRRFTVLDLAQRTGTLSRCLEHLFGPQGIWSVATPTPPPPAR